MHKVCSVLFLLLYNSLQAKDIIIDKLNTTHGLSQNTINCVLQGQQGFMWFGTDDGLNRYDGYEFTVYRPERGQPNSLASLPIVSLCEDDNANLWIAFADDYLDVYNLKTEQLSHVSIQGDSRPDVRRIYNFDGVVYVLTYNAIYKVDSINEQQHFELLFSKKGDEFKIFRLIHRGHQVWVLTNEGLTPINELIKHQKVVNGMGFKQQPNDVVCYGQGFLMAYSFGLFYFWPGGSKKIMTDSYTNIHWDGGHHLWLANKSKLAKYTVDARTPFRFTKIFEAQVGNGRFGLSSGNITNLYQDRYNNIWIGTQDKGINKITPEKSNFRHFFNKPTPGSISKSNIQAMHLDRKGGLWVGLPNCRIDYMPNPQSLSSRQNFETFTQSESNSAYKISRFFEFEYQGKHILFGNHLIAKDFHAFELGDKPKPTKLPSKLYQVNALVCDLIDDGEQLWIGSYSEGLYRYIKQTGELQQFRPKDGVKSDIVRSLLLDTKGNLWIGTDKGIQRIMANVRMKKQLVFSNFDSNRPGFENLGHEYVLPIIETTNGTIWVGTLGGGLSKFVDDSVGFKTLDISNGLPNNVIKAIVEDNDGYLWVSSNKGLSRINTSSLAIQNFNTNDGLQGDEFAEFSGCKLSNGNLIFGGVNGFNMFVPKAVSPDYTLPALVFTKFSILGQTVMPNLPIDERFPLQSSINTTKQIVLNYNENSFTLYFSALQFKSPKKLKYRYKLEGFDTGWNESPSKYRFARYTRVKPGRYELKVMVSNTDGTWASAPKVLQVTINQPFWLSIPAYLLYALLFVGCYYLYHRQKKSKALIKQKLLIANFEKENMEALHAAKLKFFTNVSHELRTPLTIINSYIDKITSAKRNRLHPETENDLMVANNNTKILLKLVNQLMDFSKLEQKKMQLKVSELDIVAFVYQVSHNFKTLAETKDIILETQCDTHSTPLWFDPSAMERVMYNLLANAIKYTPEGGHIKVHCSESPMQATIVVQDNGIGIKEEKQAKIFERYYQSDGNGISNDTGTGIGMSLVKDLVDLHCGNIVLKSQVNEGTSFTLTLLKGCRHFKKSDVVFFKDRVTYQTSLPVISTQEMYETPGKTPMPLKNREKVLIVEDNNELRRLVKDSFEGKYYVIEAENGKVGLEKCMKYAPGLVISDVMMPEMDGISLCKAIKTNIDLSHIPILLLTAKSADENQLVGYDAGAEAYIVKPFNIDILLKQVESIFLTRQHIYKKLAENPDKNIEERVLSRLDQEFVAKLHKIINENLHNSSFTVQQLVNEHDYTHKVLNKKIQHLFGMAPLAYIRSKRLCKAAKLLESGSYTVAQVTYEVGFEDTAYFRKCFKKQFGVNPSEYAKLKI